MTPRRILVGGWLLFVLYAYPGYMMGDGADQLVDSRYGSFTDWHSPILSEVWRLVEHVIGGPFGMLVLQSLLLLLGGYAIAKRLVSERAAAWVAVALLLAPPLLVTNAIVAAQPQLGAWLVGGLALLLSERFGRRVLGLACMVIAAGMHEGAAAALLPLIVATFTWRTELSRWRRVAVAFGAWVVVVLLSAGLTRALVDTTTEREPVRLAMFDIDGILDRAPKIDDAHALELLGDTHLASADGIQAHARALQGKDLANGPDRLFEPAETDDAREALYRAHRAMIRAYPGPYLATRFRFFFRSLGLKRPGTWNPVYTEFVASEQNAEAIHHAGHHSLVQRILIAPVRALRNTFVFRPIYYLALAIVLLGIAIWRRRALEATLLASALAYEIGWMFQMTRVEYRDSHPMILLTLAAAFLMLARRVTAQPPA